MKTGIILSTAITFSMLLMAGAAHAAMKQVSSDNYFGCTNRDYFEQLVSYAVQKDMAAFKQGLVAGMLSGQCTKFKAGEQVFIQDTAIFSGLVKLRRQGDMSEYWTNMEAVK